MARLQQYGLRRTVGVPGLFATAYGNVGSSIYYALGLVAAHALGLTPVVFMLAGGLFALTAKTYAEGAAMFPEAGGSSSFARHAQILLVVVGTVLVLDPSLLVHQVHLGTAPSWSQVIFALSVAMVAYTGLETVSNMAEEARDPGRDVPRAVNLVLIAVLGVYAGISVVALSALPVVGHGAGAYTLLGQTPPHGYQNDPVLGIISHPGLATGATHA